MPISPRLERSARERKPLPIQTVMMCSLIPMSFSSALIAEEPQALTEIREAFQDQAGHDVTPISGLAEPEKMLEGEVGLSGFPPLWTPSSPFQNQFNEPKRVLGKILFWDEQLSSDNTMSCGTCHIGTEGGADPRDAVNPGFDQNFMTADDVFGSLGVLKMDEQDNYQRSDSFGLEPQVTPRVAQSNMMGMFSGNLFWDGRAELNFIDPETGELLFQSGVAGLEIQATAPIMSDVEMAHAGRTWDQVRDKLNSVRPLALSDDIPQDMMDAVQTGASYADLFEDAFGDSEINAVRIAYALATYQRTLIPNETPFDLWNDGDTNALTADQIEGLGVFQASACGFCHAAPTFSNFDMMADGVRPSLEDIGRQGVTKLSSDRGKFKTASIRNMSLRTKLMHNGRLTDVDDIFDFYGHRNGLAPVINEANGLVRNPIRFNADAEAKIKDFLVNGLTDPRVANETYPFDRPHLYSEHNTPNPSIVGSGEFGSGGFVPAMIAVIPPNLGNADFKVGIDFALGGAEAWVAVSQDPPVDGVVASDELLGPINLAGMGNGGGYCTMHFPITNDPTKIGTQLYIQWIVTDPAGDGGFVRSPAAQLDIFCTESTPCTIECIADFNGDGLSDFFDISAFLSAFSMQNPAADLSPDGVFDFFDISEFLTGFGQGCP